MAEIRTGKFETPSLHHKGKYKVFRFPHAVEIWLGKRWIIIDWGLGG